MLKTVGIAQKDDLIEVMPSLQRLKQGPVAIFECFQPIPCNPCENSCPKNAVVIGEDINNIPFVDHDKCNGCSKCVSVCPGLAVFLIDLSKDKGNVTLPYEFCPLPKKGEEVYGLDRSGKIVEICTVTNIRTAKSLNSTTLLSIETSKDKVNEIRFIKLKEENNER
ncbi:4Fe-4S dicluster domain-containing protein [Proteinivorax hydrogeniformans]|uniref:4Fe-4S dicluster domain-containing protein n=1 Tax=Proteinivorax hydrogeniformans TaxID=1826727 RepID=A0AAU8HWI7_9FIRM